MNQSPEPERRSRPSRILAAVVFAAGLVIMLAVLAADIGGTPALEAWAHALGLAWAPLLQALGLALLLTGGWMLWRAGRRGD